jgi:hypothetical protein
VRKCGDDAKTRDDVRKYLDEVLVYQKNVGTKFWVGNWIVQRYLLKYENSAGFGFKVDAILKSNPSLIYIANVSLYPPGGLHSGDKNIDDQSMDAFTCTIGYDPDSDLFFQKLKDQDYHFRPDSPLTEKSFLLVEILGVQGAKVGNGQQIEMSLVPEGWTVIPLLDSDGFLLTGSYQFPVCWGEADLKWVDGQKDKGSKEVYEKFLG